MPGKVMQLLPFGLGLAVVLGGAGYYLFRPGYSTGFGPEARAMDCAFAEYCVAGDCAAPLPGPARIVLNGPYGRSFMDWGRPLGQATVLPGDGMTTYAGQLGGDIWAVFVLDADRAFAFRKTERLIEAEGRESGRGTCSAPAPIPEA